MSDYEVGYKKPPKSGQFRPGQSGNPRGAKRKEKRNEQVADVMRRVSEEEFNLNGRTYTAIEMMLTAMRNKAMKGDNVAARTFIALQRELGLMTPAVPTGGGVLVVPGTSEVAAWTEAAKAQQAKFRGEDPEGLAELARGAGMRQRE